MSGKTYKAMHDYSRTSHASLCSSGEGKLTSFFFKTTNSCSVPPNYRMQWSFFFHFGDKHATTLNKTIDQQA